MILFWKNKVYYYGAIRRSLERLHVGGSYFWSERKKFGCNICNTLGRKVGWERDKIDSDNPAGNQCIIETVCSQEEGP